jgi:hypothetical protein
MWTDPNHKNEWVQRVRNCLRVRGYYYEPEFCTETTSAKAVMTAARLLGILYVPSGLDSTWPVIQTRPSSSAPRWRPFDRGAPISWHNDFSTRAGRPELSLSCIQQGDPAGPCNGAWHVASTEALLAQLCQIRQGRTLTAELKKRAEPFGYCDAGSCRLFRVIVRGSRKLDHPALRFYGRALEEGALLRFGIVPERTREIVARIEEAADAVSEVLYAKSGALLIVHNNRSVHYRAPQTVTGVVASRRRALLCFVRQLHRPL